MILGEDTPDEGSISMDEYAIVGYLPPGSQRTEG